MNDPPGTIPPRSQQAHPRRPPAHRSVSLRHSPPAEQKAPPKAKAVERQPTSLSSPNPASDKANPPSVSPKLLSNKHSSGESSDAGKWFESTNNNARQSTASFADNDPPFFLRNSSSSETPPDNADSHYLGRQGIPYRPNLQHIGTDGSSTEDFRSVIDDLTVVNKRLKQKLKKYEKLYDAHLQEDKLFEVRFHGLPDHKKKELEETLRKFAAGLDDSAGYPPVASYVPTLDQQQSSSSMSRLAESGYASMSASGRNSSAPSNQASNQTDERRKMSRSAYNRQQQDIQSYLHDIPIGLMPKSNAPMTEKSRKKLVVRRLEQIFAGKRSAPGNHPQPMQQEEVAQSAATADREEREATGQRFRPEGLRVARIMPELGLESDGMIAIQALQPPRHSIAHISEQDFAGAASPDQRPTRPLDLDPHRAQIPIENMEYFRHLGFTPPDLQSGEAPADGHGWLYLNLVINMAQLHTLNVTPDYVKDALAEFSSHLELSRDGRKIRWKGGLEVTKNHSDSSSELNSGGSPDDLAHYSKSPSKRLKTENSRGSASTENLNDSELRAKKLARAQREKEQKKFSYTPLFFRKEDTEEEDDFYGFDVESSGNSLQQRQHAGDSSGFGSSAVQSGSSTNKRREDGPMIFYNKAKFCTDLSGDRLGASLTVPGAYNAITTQPLGATSHPQQLIASTSDFAEPRGPLNRTPAPSTSTPDSRGSGEDEFGFSPATLSLGNSTDSDNSAAMINFEASGLGGVHPDDNFSIRVRRSHVQIQPSKPTGRRNSNLYPPKILALLEKSAAQSRQPIIKEEILSASRRSLPSSTLPPASFLPFDSTSSGDVDSEFESDTLSEADSESGEGPATAMQLLNVSPVDGHGDSEDEEEASQYSEDSDDGSIDMLATARQLDPNTVRKSEREYDAALADRLAEEIVAGSSAATAGGGSGFNSPVGKNGAGLAGINREAGSRKQHQSASSSSISSVTRSLKRTRTNESLAHNKSGAKASKTRKLDN